MSENTHIATAKFRQEGLHEWQSEEGLTDATGIATALDAQTEATLALAFEQRTANLIAVFNQMDEKTFLTEGVRSGKRLADQIIERLDLP